MDTSPDVSYISKKNKKRKKRGDASSEEAEIIVFTGGSKAVPIPAEIIQQLHNFLLSLPGASDRGLGYQ